MKKTPSFPGEFDLIARYFAPLAKGFPGTYGLLDDAAVIAPLPGHEPVAKTDAIVGGVHFLPDDPPDLIARKALRVNPCRGRSTCRSPRLAGWSRRRSGEKLRSRFWTSPASPSASIAAGGRIFRPSRLLLT